MNFGQNCFSVSSGIGLMSPLSEDDYVADLAAEFGLPLVVVARNALGTINHTLLTLIAAASYGPGLSVAGIVLNDVLPAGDDASAETNYADLESRAIAPLLGRLGYGAKDLDRPVEWWDLAQAR